MKNCPHCAGAIQDAAIFCKHCHRDVPFKRKRSTLKLVLALIMIGIGCSVLVYIGLAAFVLYGSAP